ncbi:autotransporter assembly complex family protein [uncultured Bartonella sp.]|uniref:autotransporter assembly complex protein TamA n=1 Tax=uncultured Bartonella sp. TaxID=104108 RepID=UPI0026074E68|nr:autotransporter assembly complex family protein [uncultured Bartonella sp.]
MVISSEKSRLKTGSAAIALLACFALAFSLPQKADAFDLFGIHLWGKKKQTDNNSDVIGIPKHYKVKVSAVPGAPEEGVKIVKSASSLVDDEDKPASGSAGLLAKARGDYRKILAALYAEGYYGGTISILVNGAEAANIRPDAELPDQSEVEIAIDTGPEYHFDVANIFELAPHTDDRKDKVPLPKDSGYAAGDIAKSGSVFKAEQLAVEGWRQQGYAKAAVTKREVVADHATRTVDANIEVNPGRQAHYGALTVTNVSDKPRMDSPFVAWMTGLQQGQEYDPDDIAKANKRLARLDVFRTANVKEADKIEPDGALPLNLVVQERPPHRFGAGGSYSTIDGAGLEAYWMQRNLFGHAERLRFDAKISGIGGNQDDSYNPKNFSYLVGSTFTRPGVITPDTDFVASLKGQREVLDNYTTTGITGQLGLTQIFSDELSGRLYFNAAQTKSEDDYFGNRDFTPVGFLGGLLYDSRDNKSNPKHGLYGEAVVEPIYEIHYGNFIGKTTLEGRSYFTLDAKERYVIATRAKLGSITGPQAREIPSDMLFFAGGGGSVRGYGYRNIGIRTNTGDTIGGRSLVEGSAELRTMITDTIGLVGFVDAGVVGEDTYPDFSENTKVGVGIGLRYMTGLGPLRFDVATPLDGAVGDPDLGFYIGIGQAF